MSCDERSVTTAGTMSESLRRELADVLDGAQNPALVLGPQVDAAAVDDPTVYEDAVVLAERLGASVLSRPRRRGARSPQPIRTSKASWFRASSRCATDCRP